MTTTDPMALVMERAVRDIRDNAARFLKTRPDVPASAAHLANFAMYVRQALSLRVPIEDVAVAAGIPLDPPAVLGLDDYDDFANELAHRLDRSAS